MTTKQWMSRCPYKDGSASRKIYAAIARAGQKGLSAAEVSRAAHVPADKTRTLLVAYKFPSHHCSSLTCAGVRLVLESGRYRLVGCKADPRAHRPPPKNQDEA